MPLDYKSITYQTSAFCVLNEICQFYQQTLIILLMFNTYLVDGAFPLSGCQDTPPSDTCTSCSFPLTYSVYLWAAAAIARHTW